MPDVQPRSNAAQHGTRSKYCTGCRCTPCRDAARAYAAKWRRRSRENGWKFVHGYRVRWDVEAHRD